MDYRGILSVFGTTTRRGRPRESRDGHQRERRSYRLSGSCFLRFWVARQRGPGCGTTSSFLAGYEERQASCIEDSSSNQVPASAGLGAFPGIIARDPSASSVTRSQIGTLKGYRGAPRGHNAGGTPFFIRALRKLSIYQSGDSLRGQDVGTPPKGHRALEKQLRSSTFCSAFILGGRPLRSAPSTPPSQWLSIRYGGRVRPQDEPSDLTVAGDQCKLDPS